MVVVYSDYNVVIKINYFYLLPTLLLDLAAYFSYSPCAVISQKPQAVNGAPLLDYQGKTVDS